MHPEAHRSSTCARQAITALVDSKNQLPVLRVNITTNMAKAKQMIVNHALTDSTVLLVQHSLFNAWLATLVADQQQLQLAATRFALLAHTQVVKL